MYKSFWSQAEFSHMPRIFIYINIYLYKNRVSLLARVSSVSSEQKEEREVI